MIWIQKIKVCNVELTLMDEEYFFAPEIITIIKISFQQKSSRHRSRFAVY